MIALPLEPLWFWGTVWCSVLFLLIAMGTFLALFMLFRIVLDRLDTVEKKLEALK